MNNALRLSDLLGRGIVIEWYEAVALVREVSDRVVDTSGGLDVPELHQIELTDEGRISLSGATRTDEPVRRLGQLLQAALADADPPVQLRLVVSQATSPAPVFGSVRLYSEALAYFERPDRAGVLRGLYARAAAVPAPERELDATLDMIAPLQHAEPVTATRPTTQFRTPWRALALMAAIILLAVGAAAYWKYGATGPRPDVSVMAVKATDAVGTALVTGLSAVSERVGLGRLASSDPSGAVPPAKPVATTARSVPSVSRKPVRQRETARAFQAFDIDPVPALDQSVRGGPEVAASLMAQPSAAADEPAPDSTVYSVSDTVVVPPLGLRPQLPRALPENVDNKSLAQIELIVLPDGSVNSVKLLGHRNVLDSMLLSAVKAWQFKPALKNGRPVTYRKTVWLVLQ